MNAIASGAELQTVRVWTPARDLLLGLQRAVSRVSTSAAYR